MRGCESHQHLYVEYFFSSQYHIIRPVNITGKKNIPMWKPVRHSPILTQLLIMLSQGRQPPGKICRYCPLLLHCAERGIIFFHRTHNPFHRQTIRVIVLFNNYFSRNSVSYFFTEM